MDPITLLQVTHVEQRLARRAAAAHNLAVRERRERPTGGRRFSLVAALGGRRAGLDTPACAAC